MNRAINDKILSNIYKVEKWIEDHNYKGYEPFDGLSSKFRQLTLGNIFLMRILLQLIRQSPVNLRPLFGVIPLDSTIGRGYMAWGYCHMLKITGNEKYRKKIQNCLTWLIENKSPGYKEFSWGKHFDFASRGGLYKSSEPILIWTALIGHSFLDAYDLLKDEKYIEVSDSICKWILKLPRNITNTGFCMGYHYNDLNSSVHNSNMVGSAMLSRMYKIKGEKEYLDVAESAMTFSCTRQLPNGAWWYGESENNHWIDNFHTGYNLDALKCYIENTGDTRYEKNLSIGFEYYKQNFFELSGRPKYYNTRTYPVDSQCISQSIDTLANFSERDNEALALAKKVAGWAIDNMQDKKGFFYYRQYPLGIISKTPMLHWAQATTYKALSHLLQKNMKHTLRR